MSGPRRVPSSEIAVQVRKAVATYDSPVGYNGDAVSFKQAYFDYDGDGRTTSLYEYGWQLYPVPYSYSSTTLAEQVSYNYDGDGRVTGLTDYGYGGLAYGGGYGSGYGGSYGGTFALEQYSLEYDADSRIYGLTNSVHTSDNATYLYDADSELANAIGYGSAYGGQYTGNDQASSVYDPNGNPTGTGVAIGAGNRLLADGTYNYTYDAAGNMRSQINRSTGVGMFFGYDADNRLSTVVMQNASGQTTANISLTYDVQGDLIGRSATTFVYSGGTTYSTTTTGHFVYDPVTNDMVLAFDGNGNLTDRFLYGPAVDEILAQENVGSPLNANTTWMVTNYQGSVVNNLWQGDTRYGSNPSSNVSYSPFGQTNFAGGLFFGYTGAYTDPLTAMQYHSVGNKGRWTTANGQIWIQPDPTGLGPDFDPYRVCGNDPVNETDPTGLVALRDVKLPPSLEEQSKAQDGSFYLKSSSFNNPDGTITLQYHLIEQKSVHVPFAWLLGFSDPAYDENVRNWQIKTARAAAAAEQAKYDKIFLGLAEIRNSADFDGKLADAMQTFQGRMIRVEVGLVGGAAVKLGGVAADALFGGEAADGAATIGTTTTGASVVPSGADGGADVPVSGGNPPIIIDNGFTSSAPKPAPCGDDPGEALSAIQFRPVFLAKFRKRRVRPILLRLIS